MKHRMSAASRIGAIVLLALVSSGRGQAFQGVDPIRQKAAEQGNTGAQFNLGILYDNGRGVSQDYAEARKWYLKAAEQGHAGAQGNLGFLYDQGQGVPQDYVTAYLWLNLAASSTSGDDQKKYASARDETAAKMTAAQVAEAQRLAREWKLKSTFP